MDACLGGSMESCRNLGFMLELGEGGQQDVHGAMRLYQISCDSGIKDSCQHLDRLKEKSPKK